VDAVSIYNYLSWVDGVLFTLWIGLVYYGKCWIDYKFKKKDKKTTYPEFVKKHYKNK